MSAIPVSWERGPGVPPQPQRPRLQLVPTGDAVMPARTWGVPPLRITRRGRLFATCAVLATVLLAGAGLTRVLVGSSSAPALPTVTVRQGDTLSQIAHRGLPGLPVREAVARVQIANRMNTLEVHAGETLRIPR